MKEEKRGISNTQYRIKPALSVVEGNFEVGRCSMNLNSSKTDGSRVEILID